MGGGKKTLTPAQYMALPSDKADVEKPESSDGSVAFFAALNEHLAQLPPKSGTPAAP